MSTHSSCCCPPCCALPAADRCAERRACTDTRWHFRRPQGTGGVRWGDRQCRVLCAGRPRLVGTGDPDHCVAFCKCLCSPMHRQARRSATKPPQHSPHAACCMLHAASRNRLPRGVFCTGILQTPFPETQNPLFQFFDGCCSPSAGRPVSVCDRKPQRSEQNPDSGGCQRPQPHDTCTHRHPHLWSHSGMGAASAC